MKIKRIGFLILCVIGLACLVHYFPEELASINRQYGVLITISISILIPWLTSERWVEHYRLKREHSKKLAEVTMQDWIEHLDSFTNIRAEPNQESMEFEAIYPSGPDSLDYYQYLEQHLKEGYADILELWNIIMKKFRDGNEYYANLLLKLQTDISNDDFLQGLDLRPYNQMERRIDRIPSYMEFYSPDSMAISVLKEINNRFRGLPPFYGSRFKFTPTNLRYNDSSHLVYDIQYDNNMLARTLNEEHVQHIQGRLDHYVINKDNIDDFQVYLLKESELESAKNEFITKINNLIWYIELGNNLKGDCPFCPPGILSSIKNTIFG